MKESGLFVIDKNICLNKITESDLVAIHKLSRFNKENVENCNTSGCFNCLEKVNKEDIEFYCDDGETVICPNCGTDSVITSTYPLSQELLLIMKKRWFGYLSK